MTLDQRTLRHNLHWSPGLFVRLGGTLDEVVFRATIAVLEEHAGPSQGASPADHWKGLQVRLAGRSAWETIAPVHVEPLDSVESHAKWASTVQTATRIVDKRGYSLYVRDGIGYVVDVFNPGNELQLSYKGAGEPVLCIQMAEMTGDPKLVFQRLPIRDRLGDIDSFYAILNDLVAAIRPEGLVGGALLGHIVMGCAARGLSASPWEFVWTLMAIEEGRLSPEDCAKESWRAITVDGYDHVILQLVPRFDVVMGAEQGRAAKLLGLRSPADL